MRNVSTDIRSVISSKGYSSYWLFDLHLPAQDALPGVGAMPAEDFYISDSAVTANGHFYQPLLRSQKPRMIQTLGKAPDGGSIVIDNIECEIGQSLLKRGRNFVSAPFTLWKAFLLGNGQLAVDKWMEGEIRSATVSESDQTISFQLGSDLLKRQSVMGAFMLSQRCIVAFNKGGLLTPAQSNCGWQTVQGGDPNSCDKSEDGINGCRAHGNLHRMIAVPAVAASSNISSTGGTGFDDPPPHGGCFLAGTPVLMADGGSKKIEDVLVGDEVAAPVYDEATGEDRIISCLVESVWQNTADEWLEILLPHGKLFVTPRHRFYTGHGTFRQIGELEVGETVRVRLMGKFHDCKILEKTRHTGEARIHNISVQNARTYFANRVAVHNQKPILPNGA
jgi:hypothetical protein